jgi:hypothetical protein
MEAVNKKYNGRSSFQRHADIGGAQQILEGGQLPAGRPVGEVAKHYATATAENARTLFNRTKHVGGAIGDLQINFNNNMFADVGGQNASINALGFEQPDALIGLKTINGLSPDSAGNIFINGSDLLRFNAVGANSIEAALAYGNLQIQPGLIK